MIGRSLAGVCESHVFVMGTENAPGLRPWIDEAAKGRPLTVGLLGADILVLNRSDYGPFRSRGIPFLFFTTGENPRYHKPDDTAETLNYAEADLDQPDDLSSRRQGRRTPRPFPAGRRTRTIRSPRPSPSGTCCACS